MENIQKSKYSKNDKHSSFKHERPPLKTEE